MIIFGMILHCVLFLLVFDYLLKADKGKLLNLNKNFWPQSKKGNLLYKQLLEININHLIGGKDIELTQYKFFTHTVEDLLKNALRFGVGFSPELQHLKRGILNDICMDKKIFSLYLGGVYQIFVVMILGGVFCYFLETQLSISLDSFTVTLPFLLQFTGILSFTGFFIYSKTKSFNGLALYVNRFYQLKTLGQASVPLKLVSQKMQLNKLPTHGELKSFKNRILFSLEQVRLNGHLNIEDVDIYINEMWQAFDIKFETFNKNLNILKLIHLVCFALSGYMFLLLQVFSRLTV